MTNKEPKPQITNKQTALNVLRELAKDTHIDPTVRLNAALGLMEYSYHDKDILEVTTD